MSLSRREFLEAMGGAGLLYAFRFAPSARAQGLDHEAIILDLQEEECVATILDIDYSKWVVFSPDGYATVFTGRTELGQGLKTVITAVVSQALEIPDKQLTVVMGDTDLCPDDGPTTGSSATRTVGWGFWVACLHIKEDLLQRASNSFGVSPSELEYREGGIGRKDQIGILSQAYELGKGQAVILDVDPKSKIKQGGEYVDLGIPNVNSRNIVTGRLKYAGDVRVPGALYADYLTPPYHVRLREILAADLSAARTVPGVKLVDIVKGDVAAVGKRYSDVLKALEVSHVTWKKPDRPRRLRVEKEIRAGAKQVETIEKKGDIELGLGSSDLVISETYLTQYAAQAPIETDTAVAKMEEDGNSYRVWAATQSPYKVRESTARYVGVHPPQVRIMGMPVGGGFGAKISNHTNAEAALLAKLTGSPVKVVYSRKNQFQHRGSYKAAVLVDISTGVKADGRIFARKIDSYQDVGFGTTYTYDISHVLTRLYKTEWPFPRAISRGTSYVQNCFATESHIDMVAAAIGMDPVEIRRKNVLYPEFIPLLDACAELIGYNTYQASPDEGIGFALVVHGGNQLGVVAAEVSVGRSSGEVKVKRLCAAYDIGTVINRRMCEVGIRGAMTWGLGYALKEEIKLDGHGAHTTSLSEYGLPRFSDIPPIEMVFLDNIQPGAPRGCGEMPMIPTIGAICNGVYKAVGVRFRSTPLTPERVRKKLS